MDDVDLDGRTALVTGSTASESGMGYAIASGLAEAGASVILNGRTEDAVTEATDRLRDDVPGADARGVPADLCEPDDLDRLFDAITEVDVLVHNAGEPEAKPFFELTDDDWHHQFQLHVMAGVRLARHYARGMVERDWGRVLFNASTTAGFRPGEMVHYGATKTALLGLTRGLAESLPGSDVTVNAFVPGPTRERTEESLQELAPDRPDASVEDVEADVFDDLSHSIVGRFIEPEEVANLVVFLASDRASAITGTALRVDGGIVRSLL